MPSLTTGWSSAMRTRMRSMLGFRPVHFEQPVALFESFELMLTPIEEASPRPTHQRLRHLRNEDLAACGGGGDKQVTGLVLEAVGRNFNEIEVLRLRDDDGRVWEFSTDGPVGISAAHLRQHQVAGETILVTYREEGGRLIAVDVSDPPVRGRYGR